MAFVDGLPAFLTAGGALLTRGQVTPNTIAGPVVSFVAPAGNGGDHTRFRPEQTARTQIYGLT